MVELRVKNDSIDEDQSRIIEDKIKELEEYGYKQMAIMHFLTTDYPQFPMNLTMEGNSYVITLS